MLQKIGMMHLQDRQAGTQLDALKASGQFDPQPGQGPDSAAIPFGGALYSAAQKGPLGSKQAILGTLNNYMNMSYQMKLMQKKYMYEQGLSQGGMHQGSGGQGGQPAQQGGGGQQGSGFDLSKAPPPGQGMNQVPWDPKATESNSE